MELISRAAMKMKAVATPSVTFTSAPVLRFFYIIGDSIKSTRVATRNQRGRVLAKAALVGRAFRSWQASAPDPRPLTGSAPTNQSDAKTPLSWGTPQSCTTKGTPEQNRTDSESIEWETNEHGVSRSILGPAPAEVQGGHDE